MCRKHACPVEVRKPCTGVPTKVTNAFSGVLLKLMINNSRRAELPTQATDYEKSAVSFSDASKHWDTLCHLTLATLPGHTATVCDPHAPTIDSVDQITAEFPDVPSLHLWQQQVQQVATMLECNASKKPHPKRRLC